MNLMNMTGLYKLALPIVIGTLVVFMLLPFVWKLSLVMLAMMLIGIYVL
jgi:hypothetical protein